MACFRCPGSTTTGVGISVSESSKMFSGFRVLTKSLTSIMASFSWLDWRWLKSRICCVRAAELRMERATESR